MNQHPQKVEVTSGYLVPLNVQEEKDLKEFLKDNDYPEPPEGLKEFILDSIYGEDEEEEIELPPINPELVNKVFRAGKEFLFGKEKPRPKAG